MKPFVLDSATRFPLKGPPKLDGPEFAISFFGAIKIGAVPVPVNTLLKPADYQYILNNARARVAVSRDELVVERLDGGDVEHLGVDTFGGELPGRLERVPDRAARRQDAHVAPGPQHIGLAELEAVAGIVDGLEVLARESEVERAGVFHGVGHRLLGLELIGRLHAPNILEFSSDPPAQIDLVAAIPGAYDPRPRGNHWSVAVGSLVEAIPALLLALEESGAKIQELSTRRAMLEDVFLALTGRELRDE